MSKVCSHCGANQSVCWRRGPEDKPLLCNACGARYLVKRSLEGYFPHARVLSKKTGTQKQPKAGRKQQGGQLGVSHSTAHLKKHPRSSRSARNSPKGSTDSGSRNSETTLVSRGTQTIPLFLPSIASFQEIGPSLPAPPRLFTKHLQGFAGDDFSGVAVSALTLLRHSDKESSSAELGSATPTQIVRRHPRKPAKATIRALF